MKLRLLCLLLCFVAVSASLRAAEPLRTAADRPADIKHIRLELDVSLKEQRIAGSATIDFVPLRALRTLTFDAVGHEVSAVKAWMPDDGQTPLELDADNTGKQIVLTFDQQQPTGKACRVRIDYTVREPATGLHFFKPTKAEPKTPWMVWSQGESTDNRHWFPCFDHPNERQTTELIATVDSKFTVLSNGELVSKKASEDGSRTRYHWSQKKSHVAYLVTLVVGEFAIGKDEWRGRPVLYYAPPERKQDIDRTFGRTVEMLEFFSQRFGIEYAWPKYAQVVVEQFIMGGMENTSATTLYSAVMHDERALLDSSPDWLIAHELGHQWWGDLVTCKDWSHLWLNEGFATYCEVLWAEHKDGADERDYRLYGKSRSARTGTALTRPVVDRFYATPGSMFDSRAYPKGGWVLHMLRRRVGDDSFFRAIQRYGTLYAYQTAETSNLRLTMERLLGVSLERFFHDWTERPGHPVVSVKTAYQPTDQLVEITLKQTQKADAFHFPLTIEIQCEGSDKPVTLTRTVEEKEARFFLPVPGRPTLVRVDPDYSLLCELKEEKTRGLWSAQLKAPTVPERIRAVEHFGASKTNNDRKLLAQTLAGDAFFGVRVEAAKALGKSGGDASRDALIAGLSQSDARVRGACASALGKFVRDEKVIATLKGGIAKGDAGYKVEAAFVSSLFAVEGKPDVALLLEGLGKDSHRDVIRTATLRGLSKIKEQSALQTLLTWCDRGHPRTCRIAAMSSVAKWLTGHEAPQPLRARVIKQLAGYLEGEGPRVRRAAVESIRDLGSMAQSLQPKIAAMSEHDADRRVRIAAVAALEKLQSTSVVEKEVSRLRSELKTLRKKNDELEKRLQKLESK